MVQTKVGLTWSQRSPESKKTMPAMRNSGPVTPQCKVRFFVQLAKHPMAIAKRHADGDAAWSGCQTIPMRLSAPHATSDTTNQ
jgi:hypothetical protein